MVLYAGIVHDGRNYMFFTMDEVALIDGLIATYFVSDSVSDSVAGTSATDASSGKEAAKQDVKETKEVKAADAITSLTTKRAILLLQTPRKMRKEPNS